MEILQKHFLQVPMQNIQISVCKNSVLILMDSENYI